MKLLFSDWEKEYPTNKEIDIDLNNPNLWIAIRTKMKFSEPIWEKIVDDTIEFVEWFIETEDEYIVKCSNWYDYKYKKSDVFWKHRFYELQSECWNCWKLIPYNERFSETWKHYKWTEKEFTRTWNFCSEKCVEDYVKNNDFIIN